MCGRYAFSFEPQEIPHELEIDGISATVIQPTNNISLNNSISHEIRKYNIVPTTYAPVLFQENSINVVRYMKFGLIPYWNNSISQIEQAATYKTINAKKETILASRLWSFYCAKHSYRCAIPVQGYFEWQKLKDLSKIPYYIQSKKKDLIYLAGLYSKTFVGASSSVGSGSSNQKNHKDIVYSFAIITTNATEYAQSSDLKEIHPRMPMMLTPETKEWDTWLNPNINITTSKALNQVLTSKNILKDLKWYQVSKDVNYSINDARYLIEPVKDKSKKKDILGMMKSKKDKDNKEKLSKIRKANKEYIKEEETDKKSEKQDPDEKQTTSLPSESENTNDNKHRISSGDTIVNKKGAEKSTSIKYEGESNNNNDDDLIITQVSPLNIKKRNSLSALLNGKQKSSTKNRHKRRHHNM